MYRPLPSNHSDEAVHLKPFGAQVMIASPPAVEQRPSGLFVPPEVAEREIAHGIVMEVGAGIEDIERGDILYYHKGHEETIQDYVFVKASCIVAYDKE